MTNEAEISLLREHLAVLLSEAYAEDRESQVIEEVGGDEANLTPHYSSGEEAQPLDLIEAAGMRAVVVLVRPIRRKVDGPWQGKKPTPRVLYAGGFDLCVVQMGPLPWNGPGMASGEVPTRDGKYTAPMPLCSLWYAASCKLVGRSAARD